MALHPSPRRHINHLQPKIGEIGTNSRSIAAHGGKDGLIPSDAHGFDFQFRYHRKRWHVEVKATTGDDPQFELGISEIETANRLARTRGGLWRILRIRNALSNKPEFDWLPNPFEGDFRKHFRLHGGGMIMSYARKKP